MVKWEIEGREFANCNCSYGCPCQFNGLPSNGHCRAVFGIQIDKGYHGTTRLDGVKAAGVFVWPGAIHEGKGEVVVVVDERATQSQRDSVLRIMSGQDAEPGTFFQILASTVEKMHDPIFAKIEFECDVDARKAKLVVPGYIETRGEPILNPITGAEHRVRIDMPDGFEYRLAEIGRGWSKTLAPLAMELADSYGQFVKLHLSDRGVPS